MATQTSTYGMNNPPYIQTGVNISVSSGATNLTVGLVGLLDNTYAAICVPSWNTTWWITSKSSTGFTINFGTSPASTSQLDWTVTR